LLLSTKVNLKKSQQYKLDIISELTNNSKNLYNKALYNVRQKFFTDETYLTYGENDKLTKTQFNKAETFKEYYRLNSNSSQQILKKVEQNFKSFFQLLKKKSYGEFNKKINIPKYLGKNEHNLVIFAKISFKIFGNQIRLSLPQYMKENLREKGQEEYLFFKIPKNIINKEKIQQVQIIPNKSGIRFSLIFVYKTPEVPIIKTKDNHYISIDPGINNIVSFVNSKSGESILIDGKEIKSINRFFNKKKSILQSILNKSQDKNYSKQLNNLDQKRLNILKDKLHKISNYIINYCLENNINNIIFGQNKEWKQGSNIGKKNNQNFLNIPHSTLIEYISYKAKLNGINFKIQEESYTSKTDSLSLEPIPIFGKEPRLEEKLPKNINPLTKEKYLGRRKYRGLFKSKIGKAINADINGAINILRKHLKTKSKQESLISRILSSGQVFCPVKIYI